MQLCSKGHDEVCHDSRNCPVCEALETIQDTENKLEDANREIEGLKQEIRDLQ